MWLYPALVYVPKNMPQELLAMVCDNVVAEECIGLLAGINNQPDMFDVLKIPFRSNVWTLLRVSNAMRLTTLRLLKHLFGPGPGDLLDE